MKTALRMEKTDTDYSPFDYLEDFRLNFAKWASRGRTNNFLFDADDDFFFYT